MSHRSLEEKSPRNMGFANWLRGQFEPAAKPVLDARRLRVEYLEPRQMLSAAQPVGSEFQVNAYTSGNQFVGSIASDSAGEFVVVWDSGPGFGSSGTGEDGSGYGIYAQRYNAAGGAPGKPIPGQHVYNRQSGKSRRGDGLGG